MAAVARQSTDDDLEYLVNAASRAQSTAPSPLVPGHAAIPPVSALPESLLLELHAVSEKVQQVVWQESHKLALERAALEAEKRKQAEALVERQAATRREQHALVKEQQELRRAWTTASKVEDYQGQQVCLVVGGTEFLAAVPTLVGRAPASALAQLVKSVCDAPGVPKIFIDREPSPMHWLLRWLREGAPAVEAMPAHMLRALRAEARHRSCPGKCPLPLLDDPTPSAPAVAPRAPAAPTHPRAPCVPPGRWPQQPASGRCPKVEERAPRSRAGTGSCPSWPSCATCAWARPTPRTRGWRRSRGSSRSSSARCARSRRDLTRSRSDLPRPPAHARAR